ncbi:MAG: long-chain fatty acid--CoA ligase [Robiginitomaculum sp.]|nr:MAG: long-chain fatty acid--CoA ligase [Robiginitomaculum sp.]
MSFFDSVEAFVAAATAPEADLAVGSKVIDGVEYTVFAKAPDSLRDMFAMMLMHGDAPFLVENETRLSFAETYQAAARYAHALVGLGVKKGDRVAISMRNRPEWVIGFIGTLMAGAVATPLNSWWGTEEVSYALKDSGASIILVDPRRAKYILPLLDKQDLTLILSGQSESSNPRVLDYDALMAASTQTTPPAIAIGPEDDATLMYTSGSTGHPKGAISTNRAVITGILGYALMGLAMQNSRGEAPGSGPQPVILQTIPLFHVTGCVVIFLVSIIAARKMVLMRKWDVNEAMRLIEKERVSSLTGVPTMSADLLNAPNRGDYDLSSLTDIGAGGAARPPDHVKPLNDMLDGARPLAGYGLTETNAVGAFNAGDDYLKRPNSIGKVARPIVEIEIRDPSGNVMPTGERGEICLKSAANIRCYWNQPEATAEAFTDGWLHTGDVGVFDEEGFLYIVDRIKDIIIRGGENIATLEVEAAICAHPDVLEATVFGVPHDRLGEVVAAVVYPRPDSGLDAQTLTQDLADHLAVYKIPSLIEFMNEALPRIASGKIAKKALRERMIGEEK